MSDINTPKQFSVVNHLLPVLLLLFVGYIGFSLSLPIFPAIILDPTASFVPVAYSPALRTMYLGILIAVYPLGQALGSPLLGRLSDRYGRKPLLLLTLGAIVPAHLLTGYSLDTSSLTGLLFFRFVCGLLEGNIVIGQAVIADVSESNQVRVQNFGWVTAVVSGAFIFGPLLGGILSDSTYLPWFTYSTPFYAAALLALLSLLLIAWAFLETKERNTTLEIGPRKIFAGVFTELCEPERSASYFHNFLVYIGQFFFWSFLNVYLIRQFEYTIIQLALANAYSSIPMLFGPLINRRIALIFSTEKTLSIASLLVALSIGVFLLASESWSIVYTLLPIGFFIAMQYSFCAMLISERSSEESQGHNLGVNQSVLVGAEAITGVVGGFLASLTFWYPILAAAVFPALAAAYLTIRRQR